MNKLLCFFIGLVFVALVTVLAEFILKALLIIIAMLFITFLGWVIQIIWKLF